MVEGSPMEEIVMLWEKTTALQKIKGKGRVAQVNATREFGDGEFEKPGNSRTDGPDPNSDYAIEF